MSTAMRAPRPTPGPARAYHFPHVGRDTLANGVRLVVAPIRRLPIVTLLVITDAGALWDAPGKEGTAQLAARLLLEGAGDFEAVELTERFEKIGATAESGADWDAGVVSVTATASHLEHVFSLVSTVIRRPQFRVREVERLKSERLSDIIQLRAEPRGLADESFEAAVYAPSARYSRSLGGTENTVRGISVEDIFSLHQARYAPSTTTLVVAGDTDPETARTLADRFFGDWSQKPAGTPATADTAARDHRAIHLIEKAAAPQSELRIGQVALPRNNANYFDIVVMNAILGGLFNSRINLNLREAHAFTYGAFSSFDWRKFSGPFVVSTAVKTEVTAPAVVEVFREIDRMRNEPVPEAELQLATSYLDGVFPIRYETTAAVAAALANQIIYGLPESYFDDYRTRIRAVTADGVRRAAQTHLDPAAMQVVVVGDPSTAESLSKLGLGEFVLDGIAT
jgi:zinc protease